MIAAEGVSDVQDSSPRQGKTFLLKCYKMKSTHTKKQTFSSVDLNFVIRIKIMPLLIMDAL